MTERQRFTLWEPVQAHKIITLELWPLLKSMLMAGHRVVVEIKPYVFGGAALNDHRVRRVVDVAVGRVIGVAVGAAQIIGGLVDVGVARNRAVVRTARDHAIVDHGLNHGGSGHRVGHRDTAALAFFAHGFV